MPVAEKLFFIGMVGVEERIHIVRWRTVIKRKFPIHEFYISLRNIGIMDCARVIICKIIRK
jgi:hypothetical protein